MRVLNLDQTWINDMNFTRRKWRYRGQAETCADSRVTPRVSLQMAICTDGKVYCSMYQANTDAKVFCLFISKLMAVLAREDRHFRDTTILMIDGAKYQACPESVEHMKRCGFKVCISAPYSMKSSPIEYAFAFLKSTHLNPDGLKTGKR